MVIVLTNGGRVGSKEVKDCGLNIIVMVGSEPQWRGRLAHIGYTRNTIILNGGGVLRRLNSPTTERREKPTSTQNAPKTLTPPVTRDTKASSCSGDDEEIECHIHISSNDSNFKMMPNETFLKLKKKKSKMKP